MRVCVHARVHACGEGGYISVLLACFSQIEDTAEKMKYQVKVINPKAKEYSCHKTDMELPKKF